MATATQGLLNSVKGLLQKTATTPKPNSKPSLGKPEDCSKFSHFRQTKAQQQDHNPGKNHSYPQAESAFFAEKTSPEKNEGEQAKHWRKSISTRKSPSQKHFPQEKETKKTDA